MAQVCKCMAAAVCQLILNPAPEQAAILALVRLCRGRGWAVRGIALFPNHLAEVNVEGPTPEQFREALSGEPAFDCTVCG